MARIRWGIMGCEELGKYFTEIGVAYGPNVKEGLVYGDGHLAGEQRNTTYYLRDGKWDFHNQVTPEVVISVEEFLENKTQYLKNSYE
jgi:hypothetical protein